MERHGLHLHTVSCYTPRLLARHLVPIWTARMCATIIGHTGNFASLCRRRYPNWIGELSLCDAKNGMQHAQSKHVWTPLWIRIHRLHAICCFVLLACNPLVCTVYVQPSMLYCLRATFRVAPFKCNPLSCAVYMQISIFPERAGARS